MLFLLYSFAFVDRQILNLMIDPIRTSLGVSDFQLSLLQGIAFALFYTAFGIPLGLAADRLPRRRVILVGVVVWAVAASACGLATRYWHLLLGRLGVGAGEAALSPAAYSLLADLFPKEKLTLPTSIMGIGGAAGTSIAAILATVVIGIVPDRGVAVPLLGTLQGWQVALLLSGVPGLLLAPLVLTLPEPLRGATAARSSAPEPRLLPALAARRRFYIGHFLGFGCYSLMNYGLSSWLPTYLMRVERWSSGQAAAFAGTMPLLATLPGAVLIGWLLDRWYASGRRDAHLLFFAIAALVQLAAVLLAIGVASGPALLACLFVQATIASFTGGAAAILQINTVPVLRGRVSAVYLFVFNLLGFGVGPSAVAFVTDFVFADDRMVGWSIAVVYAVVAPIAAALLLMSGRALGRDRSTDRTGDE
ncbi:MFS transporter [Sphingomonas yantingensis]|uniref:MFS family permease n=1 Tax=Sphingomonas yantingensis TaxID=1241761 RepID=A0A7W9AQ64_9SPHN|nr:MFS family permease [Sphingomonas yantingensis]